MDATTNFNLLEDVLSSKENYKKNFQGFISLLKSQNNDQILQQLAETCGHIFIQPSYFPALSIFLSTRLLKECLDLVPEIVQNMVGEQLLDKLMSIALFKKESQEDSRGKYFFGEKADKATMSMGNSILRVVLESFWCWTRNPKITHPQFRICYQQLLDQKVKFPQQFTYYKKENYKQDPIQSQKQQQQTPSGQQQQEQRQKSSSKVNKYQHCLLQLDQIKKLLAKILVKYQEDKKFNQGAKEINSMMQKWGKGAEQIINDIFDDSMENQEKYSGNIMDGSEFALEYEQDYKLYMENKIDLDGFKQKYISMLQQQCQPFIQEQDQENNKIKQQSQQIQQEEEQLKQQKQEQQQQQLIKQKQKEEEEEEEEKQRQLQLQKEKQEEEEEEKEKERIIQQQQQQEQEKIKRQQQQLEKEKEQEKKRKQEQQLYLQQQQQKEEEERKKQQQLQQQKEEEDRRIQQQLILQQQQQEEQERLRKEKEEQEKLLQKQQQQQLEQERLKQLQLEQEQQEQRILLQKQQQQQYEEEEEEEQRRLQQEKEEQEKQRQQEKENQEKIKQQQQYQQNQIQQQQQYQQETQSQYQQQQQLQKKNRKKQFSLDQQQQYQQEQNPQFLSHQQQLQQQHQDQQQQLYSSGAQILVQDQSQQQQQQQQVYYSQQQEQQNINLQQQQQKLKQQKQDQEQEQGEQFQEIQSEKKHQLQQKKQQLQKKRKSIQLNYEVQKDQENFMAKSSFSELFESQQFLSLKGLSDKEQVKKLQSQVTGLSNMVENLQQENKILRELNKELQAQNLTQKQQVLTLQNCQRQQQQGTIQKSQSQQQYRSIFGSSNQNQNQNQQQVSQTNTVINSSYNNNNNNSNNNITMNLSQNQGNYSSNKQQLLNQFRKRNQSPKIFEPVRQYANTQQLRDSVRHIATFNNNNNNFLYSSSSNGNLHSNNQKQQQQQFRLSNYQSQVGNSAKILNNNNNVNYMEPETPRDTQSMKKQLMMLSNSSNKTSQQRVEGYMEKQQYTPGQFSLASSSGGKNQNQNNNQNYFQEIQFDPVCFREILDNLPKINKFKTCCLKSKYILHEDGLIQVGMISNVLDDILQIEIFYLNKTEFEINNLQLLINQNQNQVDYQVHTDFIQALPPQQQVKQLINLKHKALSYSILSARIQIENQESILIGIPHVITKFIDFKGINNSIEFNNKFGRENVQVIRIQQQFQKKIIKSPEDLKKFIPGLQKIQNDNSNNNNNNTVLGAVIELNMPNLNIVQNEFGIRVLIGPNAHNVEFQICYKDQQQKDIVSYILNTYYFLFTTFQQQQQQF